MKKHHWGAVAAILLLLAAVAFVLYRWRTSGFDIHQFAESLRNVDWAWMTGALALILLTYVGRSLRWEVMLRPLTKPDFLGVLRATCIGFTAVVLFGRAGEPVRPYLIARNQKVSFPSQMAAWVVERILDLLMVLLIFGLALTQVSRSAVSHGPHVQHILQAGGTLAGLAGAICLALLIALRQFKGNVQTRLLESLAFLPAPLLKRFEVFFAAFGEGMQSTRSSSFTLLLVLYSAIEWMIIIGCDVCIFHAFPATAHLGLTDVVIVLGFVSFGSVLQIPGVGGGMQIVTVLVLTEFYGISLEAASSVALTLWLVSFVVIVPVGLILAFHEGIKWRNLRHIDTGTST
ncbi:MAG TPA: lysylphosphatidylglycerol synthase transmembrane domain-containing protein [Bryobacteraceae bacterium]